MFKNKIVSFLLILATLLVLASCGKPEEPGTLPNPAETTATQGAPETDSAGHTVATTRNTDRTKATTTVEPTTEPPLNDYPYEPTGTGIYVTREGDIISAEVTPFSNKAFSETRYDEKGLKEFVEQSIKEFNEEKKSEAVTLEELTVKSGEAKLVMSYASLNYFLEFQGADFNIKHLAIMSRENAVKNYNIVNLVDPAGEAVELTTALSNAKVKVLVVTGRSLITVNGDILFFSSGMLMTGKNSVRCDDDINYSFVVFR